LIARAAELYAAGATRSARAVEVGVEASEKAGASISRALLARAFPNKCKVEAGTSDADYSRRSLMQIAESVVESRGISLRGLSSSRVLELALRGSEVSHVRAGSHSTSDFPLILADVAGKSLRMGYEDTPRTFTTWARRAAAPDFKAMKRSQLSGGLALSRVVEGGEYTHGTTHELQESYALQTFGRLVAITRQVILNDDLDAFSRVPMIYGAAAADLESDTVYGILTANAAMADGTTLFNALHANLGTAGVPSVTTLGELRKLLRLQTDLDALRQINLQGRHLVAPAALETVIDQLVTQTTPVNSTTGTPEFIRSLGVVIEPRLDASSATAYYLMADPSRVDTVEYAYLSGEEGVQIESRAGWEIDGVEVKARLDFGAKAIDHRGMTKNAG
jgi:hypothetical protein